MLQKLSFRSREDILPNSSKRHKDIGRLLSEGIFKGMVVYQEYPVSLINESCKNNRLKVDWYIKDLNIAIEVQGEAHFNPVDFLGKNKDAALHKFGRQVILDSEKVILLQAARCTIIEINPHDKLDMNFLMSKIKESTEVIDDKRNLALQTDRVRSNLRDEARRRRRESYRRAKLWRDRNKSSSTNRHRE